MVDAPEVTVIVAAYEAAGTLGEQLAALARQDAPFAWATLVCDNGSTDGTADVVQAWRGRVPGLELVDASARRGAAAARNAGAARARSPFLAFCDADDVVADGWLAALRRALDAAPLVVGPVEPALLNAGRGPTVSWVTQPPIHMPFWPRLPAGASNNMAVTAPAFAAVGGFDEDLGTAEDVDLSWRLQLSGFALAVAPDAVVHVRKRSGLRAIYRQAHAYGAGGRQLRRKYDEAAAAYWSERGQEAPAEGGGGVVRLAIGLARSTLRGRPGDAAWRLGEWRGGRSPA